MNLRFLGRQRSLVVTGSWYTIGDTEEEDIQHGVPLPGTNINVKFWLYKFVYNLYLLKRRESFILLSLHA